MGTHESNTPAPALLRRLRRCAVQDLSGLNYTAEELSLLLGVSVQQVKKDRALVDRNRKRIEQTAGIRAELGDRLAVNQ